MAAPVREPDASRGLNESLRDLIGVAEAPFPQFDPVALGQSLTRALASSLAHPTGVLALALRSASALGSITSATLARGLGMNVAAPMSPDAKDRRFADQAYDDNPYFFLVQQLYLLNRSLLTQLVEGAELPEPEKQKAAFALSFLLDALSPTNVLAGNPQAIRRAIDTGGKSLAKGLRNMISDIRDNDGWPSQVDASGFHVGENMAITPGQVVYRSPMIELIQYAPQTPKVHERPLLFCPPWINKFYIMDLAPGKSLIEWAVQNGHTCFAISYRNPDSSMRDTSFDDYLFGGPLDAIRVVREVTGVEKINTLSVCLGGTLTAIALAYSAAIGDDHVHSATFLNTHTDFSEPGVLGTFTDEAAVQAVEARMARKGYLDAKEMARTFDAIRANDLIFQYVVNNWLLGQTPPAFDLLAWNNDSTHMPARMHSQYLRSCYVRNDFSNGRFVVDGTTLDPAGVTADTFVLSAVDDHIVPWTSGYKTTQLLGGESTFVLSSSGHIAGIVNPPSPKAKYWTNPAHPTDPHLWLAGATQHNDTWWQEWTRWIKPRAGRKVAAPAQLGSEAHPPLGDAPGRYVHDRS